MTPNYLTTSAYAQTGGKISDGVTQYSISFDAAGKSHAQKEYISGAVGEEKVFFFNLFFLLFYFIY